MDTTSTLLIRTHAGDLDVVGDGRTVVGLAAPYGQVAEVDDGFGVYREQFDSGAFRRVATGAARRVQVHLQHGRDWVGRGQLWRDTDAGLYVELRLDDTEAGRSAAFKVRDQQTPGLSIGYMPGKSRRQYHDGVGEVTHRETVKFVGHIALVADPAFADARVSALRSAPDDHVAARVEHWKTFTERVRRA